MRLAEMSTSIHTYVDTIPICTRLSIYVSIDRSIDLSCPTHVFRVNQHRHHPLHRHHTDRQRQTNRQTETDVHTDIHTHTYTYIHTHKQKYIHAYTHTYIHTHACMHTYTHTLSSSSGRRPLGGPGVAGAVHPVDGAVGAGALAQLRLHRVPQQGHGLAQPRLQVLGRLVGPQGTHMEIHDLGSTFGVCSLVSPCRRHWALRGPGLAPRQDHTEPRGSSIRRLTVAPPQKKKKQ